MAQGYYEKVYKALKAGNKLPVSKAQSVKTRIKGKETTLASAGIDVKKKDTRNLLEKLINLPENQNFLFDIMDVLSRPQQALFGAISAGQKGDSAGMGAWKGLSGQEYVSGKDLLSNDADLSQLPNWAKTAGGFALDVFADPIDLALIPVTGGASVAAGAAADAAKAAGVAADAAKAVDTVADVAKKGKKLSKAAKAAADAAKAVEEAKAVKAASDVAKTLDEQKKLVSVADLAFGGMGKLVGKGAKYGDTNIEKYLEKLDLEKGKISGDKRITFSYADAAAESSLNAGKKVKTVEQFDPLTQTWNFIKVDPSKTGPIGRLETYKNLKNVFRHSFNTVSSMPTKAMNALRSSDADTVSAAFDLEVLRKRMDMNIEDAARKIAKIRYGADATEDTIKKLANRLDEDLFLMIDRPPTKITVKEALQRAQHGIIKDSPELRVILDELAASVNSANKVFNLTYAADRFGNIHLSNHWNYVLGNSKISVLKRKEGEFKTLRALGLDNIEFDRKKLTKKFEAKLNYTKEQAERMKTIMRDFKNDPVLAELFTQVSPIFGEANKIIDKHFQTNLAATYDGQKWYARHALDNKRIENSNKFKLSIKDETVRVKGNSKVLEDRKYKMSAMEANNYYKEMLKKENVKLTKEQKNFIKNNARLFKTSMMASFDDYLFKIPSVARDNKILNEILVKQTFGDFTAAKKALSNLSQVEKKFSKGLATNAEVSAAADAARLAQAETHMRVIPKADSPVPIGYKLLSQDEARQIYQKVSKIGNELGMSGMKGFSDFIKDNLGKVAIDKDILRLVSLNTDTKQINAALRAYDAFLNNFKKFKVLSPTFQLNNLMFNTSNMWLSGIGFTKQAQLYPEAGRILKEGDNLLRMAARSPDTMSKEQVEMLNTWKEFMAAGFGDAKSMAVLDFRDMPDSLKKYFTREKMFTSTKDFVVDGLPYLNNKLNIYMDTVSRLALFLEAKRNPKFLDNLDVADAGEAVRKVLFDPQDLSDFEKTWAKRVIPFYTFTKKNLAFQIKNLGKNGGRYHKMYKAYKGLADIATGGEYESMADFLKENMYVPIPALGKNGEYTMLRLTLPMGQLTDLAADPINAVANIMSPALKAPIELASGSSAFTGRPIEKFEGEKSKTIPFLTKKQEYLMSNILGIDTPIKQVSRLIQGSVDASKSDANLLEKVVSGVTSPVTMKQNVETDKLYRMYDELDRLETLIKQYEQKGYEFSTVNELNAANRNYGLEGALSKLRKLQGIKNTKNPYLQ